MGTLARSLDDLLLDGIVEKIERHRDADIIVDAGYNYLVERDKTSPWQDLKAPLVTIELESDSPDGNNYAAKFRVICLVPALTDDDLGVYRLYVLKEQVRVALMDKTDYDLGQSVGSVGKASKPSWSRIRLDDDDLEERVWSFEISYAYQAVAATGPALAQITATVGKFAATYVF